MSRKLTPLQRFLKTIGVTKYFRPQYSIKDYWNLKHLPNRADKHMDFIMFKNEVIDDWILSTDKVIGGSSIGNFSIENGIATLKGELSTKVTREMMKRGNEYSGFVNVRSKEFYPPLTLEFMDSFEMKLRSDQRIYTLQIKPLSSYEEDIYQAIIPLPREHEINQWRTVKIPFSDFFLTYRGYLEESSPKWYGQNIKSVGILMAERYDGPFKIDIEYIKAIKDESLEENKSPFER